MYGNVVESKLKGNKLIPVPVTKKNLKCVRLMKYLTILFPDDVLSYQISRVRLNWCVKDFFFHSKEHV